MIVVIIAVLITTGLWVLVLEICCVAFLVVLALVLFLIWYIRRKAIRFYRTTGGSGRRGTYRVVRRYRSPEPREGPPIRSPQGGNGYGKDGSTRKEPIGPVGRIIDVDADDD